MLKSPSKRHDIAASDFATRRKYAEKAAVASEMYRARSDILLPQHILSQVLSRKQQEQRAQMRAADNIKKAAR
jgi:hypothetical protein